MVVTESLSSSIKVSFKKRLILELIDEEHSIEGYDYVNDEYIKIESTWLKGAYEELQPYISRLLYSIEKNPSNLELDRERKSVLEGMKKKEINIDKR